MKYLPLLFLILACHHTPISIPETYPRIVHDTCTGMWAVETGRAQNPNNHPYSDPDAKPTFRPIFFGLHDNEMTGFSFLHLDHDFSKDIVLETDTVLNSDLGYEFQFKDSVTADSSFNAFVSRAAITKSRIQAEQKRLADSGDVVKRIKDSLFKCQHNYQ